jgi:hypothetical protein
VVDGGFSTDEVFSAIVAAFHPVCVSAQFFPQHRAGIARITRMPVLQSDNQKFSSLSWTSFSVEVNGLETY